MIRRITFLTLFLAALSPLAAPAAAPADPAEPAPLEAPQGTPSEAGRDGLDQKAIYRILCGGAVEQDAGLSQHLWAVAGSLAQSSWTPPRVTIRVVVSAAE